MSEPRTVVLARVALTVEIALPSHWAPDCPLAQVQKQSVREAQETIERLLNNAGVRAVVTPRVVEVICREDRP